MFASAHAILLGLFSSGSVVAGTAAFSGVGSITASGSALWAGSAAYSGNGTFSAAGAIRFVAVSDLSGVGTLTAAGAGRFGAASAFSGASSLSVTGTALRPGVLAVSGEGVLDPIGVLASSFPPDADITDGGWTDQAGGTSLFAAVDELLPDDADYIKSSALLSGESDTCVLSISPMTDPNDDNGWVLRYRIDKTGAAASLVATLKSGATTIASWTETPTGSPTTIERAITPLQVASIPDFSDLRVEFTASA